MKCTRLRRKNVLVIVGILTTAVCIVLTCKGRINVSILEVNRLTDAKTSDLVNDINMGTRKPPDEIKYNHIHIQVNDEAIDSIKTDLLSPEETNHLEKRKEIAMNLYLEFLGNVTTEEYMNIQEYYTARKTRVNPMDYRFIRNVRNTCDENEPPFLLIMCVSSPGNIVRRNAIRETWGKVKGFGPWKSKLVFIIGKSNEQLDGEVTRESVEHGDIVHVNVDDTYRNLTRKVLMALKWTALFCRGVNFFMKIDDDCFVNVQASIAILLDVEIPIHGVVVGFAHYAHQVQRKTTKWAMTYEEFPFRKMPLYASGQTYIISGNIMGRLFEAGEHMPYIFIEDGFINGILRTVIGASILPRHGFPNVEMKPASLCYFHNKLNVAATNISPEHMKRLWKNLDVPNPECFIS